MNLEKPNADFPQRIERSDLEPIAFKLGETEIVLQRHGDYERAPESPSLGSLTKSGAREIYTSAEDFFDKLLGTIPESERGSIDILVLASDTQYKGGGRRSMETAEQIMAAAKEKMAQFGMSKTQLLNISGNFHGDGGPRPESKLREPKMISDSPEFVEFLKEKYGDMTSDFWIAFEEDREREVREQMGAEGPDQIADRLSSIVEVLSRYSKSYHNKHPNRRLLIWAATHHDMISPYIKREVFGIDKEDALGVDYGAGLVINVDETGARKTKISGNEYEIPSSDI